VRSIFAVLKESVSHTPAAAAVLTVLRDQARLAA
jgi:hypothetical protein